MLLSFFRYFFIVLICNCFWNILLRTFWDLHDFINDSITNQVISFFCCFLNCFLGAVLVASFADRLTWSRSFWLYLPLNPYLPDPSVFGQFLIFFVFLWKKEQNQSGFFEKKIFFFHFISIFPYVSLNWHQA